MKRVGTILGLILCLGTVASGQQKEALPGSSQPGVKVMMMFYESKEDRAARSGPNAKGYWDAWASYGKAMNEAGIVRGGNVMTPSEAKTVRVQSGKVKLENEAYLDRKGELGGFFIIEVGALKDAEEWAAKAPAALHGAVEIRVLPAMPGM